MKANFNCLIIGLMFLACKSDKSRQQDFPFKNKKDYEETIIASHQLFLRKESKKIDEFIDSLEFEFTKTGTGLRYAITHTSQGDSIKRGDIVMIQYVLRSLDGDTLYYTEADQYQEFTVDYEDIENGLHEGVKKMKTGEKSILILPAHLGHGITGDQAAIPSQTTLVYEVNFIDKR